MTPERLAEIDAIVDGLPNGGLIGITHYNGGLRFDGPPRLYAGTDEEFGEPRSFPATDADRAFITQAPAIIRELRAEIDRLHIYLDAAERTFESHPDRDALLTAAGAHTLANFLERGSKSS